MRYKEGLCEVESFGVALNEYFTPNLSDFPA